MTKKNKLIETGEYNSIKAEYSEVLANTLAKISDGLTSVNGNKKKENTIKTAIAVGSVIISAIIIFGYTTSIGAWKKENQMTIQSNSDDIIKNEESIKANDENISEIKSKVDIIRVEQRYIQEDVTKILDKVEQ